jgi:hypothetical protein
VGQEAITPVASSDINRDGRVPNAGALIFLTPRFPLGLLTYCDPRHKKGRIQKLTRAERVAQTC